MKLTELKESRSDKIGRMSAINECADRENRDLRADERKEFDAIDAEVRQINERIGRAEKIAEFERLQEPGELVGGAEMHRELRGYNVAKAITESMNGALSGLEAEVDQELGKGREVRGFMMPVAEIIGGPETRALTTAAPGAGPGSNLIATDLAAISDRRRPNLAIERLGATVIPGLTGNMDMPRLTVSGSASWVAEHTNATGTDPQFGKKSLTPKTVTAEYEVSRRMLLQSSTALEPLLRRDLGFLLAQALDSVAIQGGGTNEPTGILADGDVSSVTGGAFDSDIAADLIAALDTDDVTGTRAFLTNPTVMQAARKTKDADSRVIPIAELFHNERVETSTQVPGDIGVGSDKNALIYGEWASLYLGYWSGIDVLVNPYHADVASKGGALLHAFLDADVVVRHPEGFRYAEID